GRPAASRQDRADPGRRGRRLLRRHRPRAGDRAVQGPAGNGRRGLSGRRAELDAYPGARRVRRRRCAGQGVPPSGHRRRHRLHGGVGGRPLPRRRRSRPGRRASGGVTMDWDKLRIFHAVAEAGSFTHAGESLNLSQSAVSRQVGALEESLGVTLFHRHARGLILTEQGELLFRTAHEVFHRLAMAEAQLTDSRERPSGELKITTTVGLGSNWLTPRIREFVDLYPDIQVNLVLTDRELDLGMREADVAIRMWQPTQPDLVQRRLLT